METAREIQRVRLEKKRASLKLTKTKILLLVFPPVVFLLSFSLGRYPVSPGLLVQVLAAKVLPLMKTWPDTVETVVFKVRLPRLIAAMLVGSSLAASGAAYQGMFRNPLVSPDILGATAGAGFGAALGIFFSLNMFGIQFLSFLLGLFAVFSTYLISNRVRYDPTVALVLTGILVGTLFSAGTSLLKYIADPYDKLPAITFWLMGSLTSIGLDDVFFVILPMLLGVIPLYLLRWRLNVLSLGEEEARALGLNIRKLRTIVILCSTLMTAACVSISGMVGWVGLIIPHLARMLVGPNYRQLLPASILLGSTYLLLVDNVARCAAAVEIPLGILTSTLGAPFFLYLLLNKRGGWY